jgi:hypothetical protein
MVWISSAAAAQTHNVASILLSSALETLRNAETKYSSLSIAVVAKSLDSEARQLRA